MVEFDENIFNPRRFVIMTILYLFKSMTEGELAKATDIRWGSLSTHLKRLEDKNFIKRKKVITSRGLRTMVEITEKGYITYQEEVKKLSYVLESLKSENLFKKDGL